MFLTAALDPFIVTTNEGTEGMVGRAPTVQFIWVLLELRIAQGMESIRTICAPKFRYFPMIVIWYPPKISPNSGVTLSTIGVLSSLNYSALLKLYEL
jgi:hypothetical protein